MTNPTPEHRLPQKPEVLIPESGMVMGTPILGAPGTGKTVLLAEHACLNVLKHRPQVLFDPIGTLTPAVLFRMSSHLRGHTSPVLHKRYWDRLRYVDVAEGVVGFPVYFRTGTERSVQEVAERRLTVIKLANPALVNAPISGWPALRRIGGHVGTVLASLGYQLDKAEDLLFLTQEWERSGTFSEAIARCPGAKPAVEFFRHRYRTMSPTDKSRLTTSFLDAIAPLTGDPMLQKVFAASTPGINWQDVERLGQTVILDFRNVLHDETKRFALLWVFLTLYEFLKRRGRKQFPFVVTIDEFAALTQQVTDGANPLAVLFNEFITQYMRNHQVWLSLAFQSIYQLDEQLRKTVLSLGNIVVGRAGTMEEARELANLLANKDPFLVKHHREKWEEEKHYVWVKHSRGYTRETRTQTVLKEWEPTAYLTLQEQQELYAQKIARLRLFEFLIRPALREGEVAPEVKPISIAKYARSSETNEYEFPNQDLVAKLRARLAERSGIPAETIRAEQESQLARPITQQPRQGMSDVQPEERPSKPQAQPFVKPTPITSDATPATVEEIRLPPMPATSRRIEDEVHPVPRSTKKTQSLPTLDEHQKALLAFLIEHPDTPISGVYKGLGVSVRKGNEIRDSLKEQGFLIELELRSGATGAGRPMKCIMPSFQTFEQLGIALPKGRGSIIHRQLQQLVAEGAGAKGYSTQKEKVLATGAIVDVHLEKGQERIAVEIAIASRPELELAHVRNCLAAGYDAVFAIFADEALLARTAQVIGEALADDVAGKVRLLPVSKISQLGR
jgi:hypothetical protein